MRNILLIGLGNPGKEYIKTRHNAGFIFLDEIVNTYNINWNNKFNGLFANTESSFGKMFFLKPQTFMNLSGKSVIELVNFYKIDIKNICVIHDELDLKIGEIKIKIGGGNAGHNGLKSISGFIGNDYIRVRIGIDRPEFKNDISNYVLSNFSNEEIINIKIKAHQILIDLYKIIS